MWHWSRRGAASPKSRRPRSTRGSRSSSPIIGDLDVLKEAIALAKAAK